MGGSGSSSKGQRQPRGGIQPSFKARPLRTRGHEFDAFASRHRAAHDALSDAHKQSLKYYQGTGARNINRAIGKGLAPGKQDKAHYLRIVEALSSQVAGRQLIAYRAVPHDLSKRWLSIKVGRVLRDPTIISTSIRKSVAAGIRPRVLLRLHIPSETKGLFFGGHLHELALAPRQGLRLLAKRVRGKGRNSRVDLDVEVLP